MACGQAGWLASAPTPAQRASPPSGPSATARWARPVQSGAGAERRHRHLPHPHRLRQLCADQLQLRPHGQVPRLLGEAGLTSCSGSTSTFSGWASASEILAQRKDYFSILAVDAVLRLEGSGCLDHSSLYPRSCYLGSRAASLARAIPELRPLTNKQTNVNKRTKESCHFQYSPAPPQRANPMPAGLVSFRTVVL